MRAELAGWDRRRIRLYRATEIRLIEVAKGQSVRYRIRIFLNQFALYVSRQISTLRELVRLIETASSVTDGRKSDRSCGQTLLAIEQEESVCAFYEHY